MSYKCILSVISKVDDSMELLNPPSLAGKDAFQYFSSGNVDEMSRDIEFLPVNRRNRAGELLVKLVSFIPKIEMSQAVKTP